MFKLSKKFKLILPVILVASFLIGSFVFAQAEITDELGTTLGLTTKTLRSMLISVIKAALGFFGIIAVSVILYGGFTWMTSGGSTEKIEKAKKILVNGLIGLVIILLSFAIVQFVSRSIVGNGSPTNPGDESSGNGALGGGIIESVYPAPGQRDVARNTFVAVTFKEEIDPTSLIVDTSGNGIFGDCLPANCDTVLEVAGVPVVKIAKQGEITGGPYVVPVSVTTNDNMTFIFDPTPILGNSSYNEWYTTELTNDINKADGTPAFGALGGFDWSFEIGTYIDTTPPYVKKVFPIASGTYAKNVVIQIQFSEAINPTSVRNDTIIVDSIGTSPVPGTLYISNQYRTVEFLGSPCGTNSCNEVIYCLPGNESITVTALAATLTGEPPLSVGPPFNGIVDMVGNSLDGDHDGDAEGPGVDDYSWNFNTTDEIEISPPTIDSVNPVSGQRGVVLRDPIEVIFSELMMQSSLRTTNLRIISPIVDYWITAEDIGPPPIRTQADINHSVFNTATDYKPEVTAGVKDMYQNCMFPGARTEGTGSPCEPSALYVLLGVADEQAFLDLHVNYYCCDETWSNTPCP
ncbi:hypothetical protein HOD96_03685 [Candidatus Falkowbacteria bacterium]|mgnify:FL=1|jgi:hypothetical protein|nr:hypothetical protein [Candidatus Falkowbacteria bacterium]MBT4433031.1 hypothetical protein [Candidatus Falkowbacteria bacterium]